jgi:hypothetical protein
MNVTQSKHLGLRAAIRNGRRDDRATINDRDAD